MRNFRSLFVNPFTLLLAFMLFIAAIAGAEPATEAANHRSTTAATPVGVDLVKYPLMPKVFTGAEAIAKMAEFGLRPVKLRYPWRGMNYHREVEGGRWVFETLPVDTIVLVNAAGDQVYKADCWNRLKWIDERPCPVCAATPKPAPGLIRRAWDGLWNFAEWMVSLLWQSSSVTIDVAGPNGPYTIDSYGSHRVVVTPRGDGHVTFDVQP
ncbi:hypothetical protein HY413_00645 [Candidatus Kaiserbacteria bacterium]|nr:hypothetical protein [Candidatus Kaiserbacteria bacterium]